MVVEQGHRDIAGLFKNGAVTLIEAATKTMVKGT
jgi:hypothetical protein